MVLQIAAPALPAWRKALADSFPLTAWLRSAGDGDHAASERAYRLVYAQLRELALKQLDQNAGHTLTPTVLVSEAYLKLTGGALAGLNDRRHFFNLAARAMRQTIVDNAREHSAQKRGGLFVRTQLDDNIQDHALGAYQALAIEQAFSALEIQDVQLAETLSWCVFGGLSTPQIAALREVTERTVQRDLALARNYLSLILGDTT